MKAVSDKHSHGMDGIVQNFSVIPKTLVGFMHKQESAAKKMDTVCTKLVANWSIPGLTAIMPAIDVETG
jgi:hypothetical protein